MFEHALRIPLVIAGPGIRPGSELDFLGTNVDLAPTILGLAGIAAPAGTDGRSIVPLIIPADDSMTIPQSVRRHLAEQQQAQRSIPLDLQLLRRNATIHEYMISTNVARQPGSPRVRLHKIGCLSLRFVAAAQLTY